MKIVIILFFAAVFYACETAEPNAPRAGTQPATAQSSDASDASRMAPAPSPQTAAAQPRTIRDFFALLPDKYFTLEGCDRATDKDCSKARAEYLKRFTEVEDIPNGYFKGGCDGGQSCIEMTIFKRPDGTYLVALATSHEMANEFRFLDYAGGKWEDVSAEVVPEYSKRNWYELPRRGTTMKVYSKKITEQGDDFEASEKGKLLYSLAWADGKFEKSR